MMKKGNLRCALTYIHVYKKSAVLTAVCTAILRAVTPYVYIFATAKIINLLMKNADLKRVLLAAGAAVIAQMLLSVLKYWLENLHLENQDGLNAYEKTQITKALFDVDYNRFEGTFLEQKVLQHRDELSREGGILNKHINSIENLLESVFSLFVALISLLPFFKSFISAGGAEAAESVRFGAILITLTLGFTLLLLALKGKIAEGNVLLRNKYAKHNLVFSYYNDFVCNYKTGKEIRIFNQAPIILKQVHGEMLEKGVPLQQKIADRNSWVSALDDWVSAAVLFAFSLLAGIKCTGGFYTVGDAVAYIACFTQVTKALSSLTGMYGKWKILLPRTELYNSILEMAKTEKKQTACCPAQLMQIQFENVNFSYGGADHPALRNLNFTVHAGEKIAVVGENGSGKTTFVKLLCALHTPDSGKILLNGTDISSLDKAEYQNLFSVVFQDSYLFSLPLGENIAVNETFDEERVKTCLKQVGFTEKYGLNTVLYRDCDKSGVNISGGEAQKLTLARALYRNKPVIVLDEPTSALDPYAEFELYRQFSELTSGKTAVYISHRLSSCRFCDKIAVFHQGELVQFGTHDELIQNESGKYYALWTAQAKYYK